MGPQGKLDFVIIFHELKPIGNDFFFGYFLLLRQKTVGKIKAHFTLVFFGIDLIESKIGASK